MANENLTPKQKVEKYLQKKSQSIAAQVQNLFADTEVFDRYKGGYRVSKGRDPFIRG